MKRNRIVRNLLEYTRAHKFEEKTSRRFLKEEMCTNAIHDNGICKTFRYSKDNNDIILSYIKIEDIDIELYPDMFVKRTDVKQIYLHCPIDPDPRYKDILGSCLMYHETGEINDKLKPEFEAIKERCVKNFDAVYSTVKIDNIDIDEIHEIISIHYSYYCIKDEFIDKINSNDVIFGEAPLPYEEWFSSDSHSIDESEKDSNVPAPAKEVYKSLKNKVRLSAPVFDINFPSRNGRYYSEDVIKELTKENKNMMIVHLLIVPEGMNEEFVNNTKKNLQSDDEAALYVSSNDIAFEPHDKYKTKYELFEYWVKSGLIHCVEFMVGYESDPEAKAFEAFIRGILINSASVDTVNLWYQKDTIERAVNDLRSDCNKSSIIRSNLNSVTDTIMDKVKVFKEYGLEDNDLDIIRNADCDKKDAYNATVDKITEIAFASDKKGSKGTKK